MGAWGHQAFENDDALDWVADLEAADDLSPCLEALDAIPMKADDYVEAPAAALALAAAEVVAALLGHPTRSLPNEVSAWVAGQQAVKLAVLNNAKRTVKRVLQNSELLELWKGSKDFAKWKACVEDLLKRLSEQ